MHLRDLGPVLRAVHPPDHRVQGGAHGRGHTAVHTVWDEHIRIHVVRDPLRFVFVLSNDYSCLETERESIMDGDI